MFKKAIFVTLILFFCILVLDSFAEASENNGLELLQQCKLAIKLIEDESSEFSSIDLLKSTSCGGYVQGYIESHQILSDLNNMMSLRNQGKEYKSYKPDRPNKYDHFCLPSNASMNQLYRVIVKYLEVNPEKLNQDRGFLVYFALTDAFPCD